MSVFLDVGNPQATLRKKTRPQHRAPHNAPPAQTPLRFFTKSPMKSRQALENQTYLRWQVTKPHFSGVYDAKYDGWKGYTVRDVEHPAIPQGRSSAPSRRDTKQSQSTARMEAFLQRNYHGE